MTRRLFVVAWAVTAVGGAGVGEAAVAAPQEAVPADTDGVARPDTLPAALRADTLGADTLAADTAGVDSVEVEARRQALGGGDFPSRDSVFERLMQLPGFRTIEYRGRDVQLDVERETVELRGDAQANYTTSVLEADSITYLSGAQFIVARGGIRLVGMDQREVTSDSVLFYDVSRLKGTIMSARTAFAERGAQWFVTGTATPRGQRTVFVERGSFTTCELEEPHYWFRAGKIKVVSENVIVAWPIVLNIHGVPVAWLPFFAQDIRPGRRSGFLPPRFGVSDIVQTGGGVNRSVTDFGYYFALSPYLDSQFTLDWFSGRFTRVNGAFRYRVLKSFLQGNVMASYGFGGDGRSLELRANHDQELSPDTDFRARISFIQNTQLFQDRTFDPRLQTQTIDSDVGFNHRFDFANFQLSGRRRQFLGDQSGRTELELPSLSMTFTPITLFGAPRGQGGPFNNMTLSGNLSANRRMTLNEEDDDVTDTRANVSQSLRIGRLNFSSSAAYDDRRTVPFDPELEEEGDPFSQSDINWSSNASFQLDLMGSTVLRPTVTASGALFRSPATDDAFVSTPSRLSLGASLSTDLYGFYPGVGGFSRIRHKISPNFSYAYSPAVSVADSLLEIPGFPARSVEQRNGLTVTIRQTFEAKRRLPEGVRDTAGAVRDTAAVPPEQAPEFREGGEDPAVEEEEPEETEAAGPEEAERLAPPVEPEVQAAAGVGSPTEGPRQGRREGPPPIGQSGQRPEEQNVVLLAINTSQLEFDFARDEGPLLVTDRLRNSLSSDLIRGLSINMTHDLFEGAGADRRFAPFLAELTGSFSLRGGGGAGAIGQPSAARQFDAITDSRYELTRFEDEEERIEPVDAPTGAGPWNLSLSYSMRRTREEEGGVEESQSVNGTLSLQPTPNWRFQWSSQYNITDREFGQHLVTLDRDLHRWQASFSFARAPNGNFLFQLAVMLRDAPELRLDYDEQSQTGR